jgi:hypothetical protein
MSSKCCGEISPQKSASVYETVLGMSLDENGVSDELAACPSALRLHCERSTENGGSRDGFGGGRLGLMLHQGSLLSSLLLLMRSVC